MAKFLQNYIVKVVITHISNGAISVRLFIVADHLVKMLEEACIPKINMKVEGEINIHFLIQ